MTIVAEVLKRAKGVKWAASCIKSFKCANINV